MNCNSKPCYLKCLFSKEIEFEPKRMFEKRFIEILLRYRALLAIASLMLTVLIAYGSQRLHFEADYKIYFESDDPHLLAHEEIQDTYTKTDNISILLRPKEGDLFTPRMLALIHELTEHAWQTPYVLRVDSVTNFQHTSAENDDLLVDSLLFETEGLDQNRATQIKKIALSETELYNRMVSKDGKTGLINVILELPSTVDASADVATQTAQRIERDSSHPEVVNFWRDLIKEYQPQYQEVEIHLNGVTVITNSFNEAAERDANTIIPFVYIVILVALIIFLRSFGSVIGSLLVIACASAAAIGSAGWFGYALNTTNISTPLIVLTIAVCDAVHLLSIYLRNLSLKMSAEEAMSESLRLNLQPIILTSITTAVGFLTLNFSISPPFQELGNMTAVGVIWAMFLTFTLLPCVTMLLVKKRKPSSHNDVYLTKIADFIITNRTPVLVISSLVAIGLIALMPLNKIDDDPISYFKPGVPFRDASDFSIQHLPSVKDLGFSINCEQASCINNPDFLIMLDQFHVWLKEQHGVEHVAVYSNIIKRLNRSMNGDNEEFYRVPEQADLSAQYNLMYEMSLPYGLDLNNQLNLDKSSTKVDIMTNNITNAELIELSERAHDWLKVNYKEDVKPGASVSLMFAHIGENNIYSMIIGGFFALLGITFTILIALKSFRYAMVSLVPNCIPAFMAFGLWGLLVGQVNMAVASVFSISLGILVDDTVHFITKYRRGRLVKGLDPEQAIHYAFTNVGTALIVTTVVLALGFGLLGISDFNLNAMTGTLVATTIVLALVFDFLMLPPILMLFDKGDKFKA